MPFVFALLVHVMALMIIAVNFKWPWQERGAVQRVIKAVVVRSQDVAQPKEVVKPKQTVAPEKKEAVKKKVVVDKKRQEKLKRQRAEKKKKREAEKRRKQDEKALQQLLAQEEQERQDAAQAAKAAALADKHKAVIRQKVSRNWLRPAGASSGLQCVVRVRLVPSGEVLEAVVVRSSGNAAFDRSVENAVYKASPLPIPQDPELFDYFRDIEFLFNPED